jgi:hypothetical protein
VDPLAHSKGQCLGFQIGRCRARRGSRPSPSALCSPTPPWVEILPVVEKPRSLTAPPLSATAVHGSPHQLDHQFRALSLPVPQIDPACMEAVRPRGGEERAEKAGARATDAQHAQTSARAPSDEKEGKRLVERNHGGDAFELPERHMRPPDFDADDMLLVSSFRGLCALIPHVPNLIPTWFLPRVGCRGPPYHPCPSYGHNVCSPS